MGRITTRRTLWKVRVGESSTRTQEYVAVEEPLEIRLGGEPFVVTMRTPGHDVELAAGYLVSEGIITGSADIHAAVFCGGSDTSPGGEGAPNTYNTLNVGLTSTARPPDRSRQLTLTSACGVCGKDSIEAIRSVSRFSLHEDATHVGAAMIASLPEKLRAHQKVFSRTGGTHAAALADAATGDVLVVREDVGRHNAVDKVIGWAALADRLPLRGTVLQVSGRSSFELVQKAVLAGIPILSAVSAPSSLAVEFADESGLTLLGFVRGSSLNVYTHPQRIEGLAGGDDRG